LLRRRRRRRRRRRKRRRRRRRQRPYKDFICYQKESRPRIREGSANAPPPPNSSFPSFSQLDEARRGSVTWAAAASSVLASLPLAVNRAHPIGEPPQARMQALMQAGARMQARMQALMQAGARMQALSLSLSLSLARMQAVQALCQR
jgi:hypothetical protein